MDSMRLWCSSRANRLSTAWLLDSSLVSSPKQVVFAEISTDDGLQMATRPQHTDTMPAGATLIARDQELGLIYQHSGLVSRGASWWPHDYQNLPCDEANASSLRRTQLRGPVIFIGFLRPIYMR